MDIATDPVWCKEDYERANTLYARLQSLQIPDAELSHLVACIVWKTKFPGLKYDEEMERRIAEVVCRA